MENKKKFGSIFLLVSLALLGFLGGVAGEMFSRAFLSDGYYGLWPESEINFSKNNFNSPNFVIREAKKVVVEQNDRVAQTAGDVADSLMAVYEYSPEKEKSASSTGRGAYNLLKPEAVGLIMTSDGWLVTKTALAPAKTYVAVDRENQIRKIGKILSDKFTGFYFFHIEARDLPVRKFAARAEVKNGQSLVVADWHGRAALTSIEDSRGLDAREIRSSDELTGRIIIKDALTEKFIGLPAADLAGNLAGILIDRNTIEPINHFSGRLESMAAGKFSLPALGFSYYDFSDWAGGRYDKGVVIAPAGKNPALILGGAAEKAGLKEGDFITAVDSIELGRDNKINEIIQNRQPGDRIPISYLRDGRSFEAEAVLSEIK